MTCPYCGAEQITASIYCENCGQQLPVTTADATLTNSTKHPFRFWLLPLIVLPVLMIAAIAGITFYQQATTDPTTRKLPEGLLTERRNQAVLICEDGSRFTEADMQTMTDCLKETAKQLQMPVGVRFGETPRSDAEASREQSIADYSAEFSTSEDGVWLYLDFAANVEDPDMTQDYLLTAGAAQLYYTNSPDCNRISEIFEQMQPALEKETADGVQAVTLFCNALLQYKAAGIPPEYYVYDSDTGQYLYEQDGEIAWHTEMPAWLSS